MLFSQSGFLDFKGLSKNGLGLREVSRREVEQREVVETLGVAGMSFPEHGLLNFDCFPTKRLRLRRVPEGRVKFREITKAGNVTEMFLTQHLLADVQNLSCWFQRLTRFSLAVELHDGLGEECGLIQLPSVLGRQLFEHIDIFQGSPGVGRAPVVGPRNFEAGRQDHFANCSRGSEVLTLFLHLCNEVLRAKYLVVFVAEDFPLDGQHLLGGRNRFGKFSRLAKFEALLLEGTSFLQSFLLDSRQFWFGRRVRSRCGGETPDRARREQ